MVESWVWMFALAVCGLGVIQAIRNIYWGMQSTQWPEVRGEVIDSFLRGGFGLPYWPVVRYDYCSSQQRFGSSRILFGHLQISSKGPALAFLRQYQRGGCVVVRVHPRRRGLSVIMPGSRYLNWVELVGG